ncbi:MAG: Trm112 family protein [Pirellulaceae bacterium]|nr:Trm112 family protein [Pirellulaceae bacterium]
MNEWLLEIIRCPITGQSLRLADDDLVQRFRQQQVTGQLFSHKGIKIESPLDAGLVNANGSYFYRMADNIPSLLADEAISLE